VLRDLVFLGTPHHGAPLERAGHWVDIVLGATPYAAPFARLGKVRSAGITDLRHGNLLDEDWVGRDRFARGADHRRQPVPLPEGVRLLRRGSQPGRQGPRSRTGCWATAWCRWTAPLAATPTPARCLELGEGHTWTGWGINHMALLGDPKVAAQLRSWLSASA
jgi:hypothetical protein